MIEPESVSVRSIERIAEGSQKTLDVLRSLVKVLPSIDPQAGPNEGPIMLLDKYTIHGLSIYRLFKFKCDSNLRKMILILRATQLGIFRESRLQVLASTLYAIPALPEAEWAMLDVEVCSRLDEFAKE